MLAIWLINTNKGRTWGVRRTVPVAVLIDPTGQHVQVHAPDVGWQPWHTGMLALAERYTTAPNQTPDGITAFVRQTIEDTTGAIGPHTPTLGAGSPLGRAWPPRPGRPAADTDEESTIVNVRNLIPTAPNHAVSLEQRVTTFRGARCRAPDLLQMRHNAATQACKARSQRTGERMP